MSSDSRLIFNNLFVFKNLKKIIHTHIHIKNLNFSIFIHYFREIALVIRDLDYFDVFNDSDLLIDVLVRVSKKLIYH